MRSVDDLTALPATITAGDSYGIVLTLSDYPATSGWSVEWAIAGASVETWTSAASGSAHRLTVTALETSALQPGTYQSRLRVTDGANTRTIQTGTVTVAADLATLAAGAGVSYEEKTLAVIEAALTGTLDGAMSMYMIGGRQVTTFRPAELLKLRDDFKARVAAQRTRTFGTPIRFDVVGMR